MTAEITERGSGDTLVVFVHGVLDRGRSFNRIADDLSSECRTVQYDRRGYGRSANGSSPVGVEDHISDLRAVLDGRPAVLVGHSFGGVMAMGMAAQSPDLVQALVLYETGLAWSPAWDDTAMQAVFADEDPEAAALRLMIGDRYDRLRPDQLARRRPGARAFIAEERSVRVGPPPFDVAAVKAPVVYGRSHDSMMLGTVRYLEDAIGRIETVTLDGADHYAHRSAPEAFTGLVRRGVELASAGR